MSEAGAPSLRQRFSRLSTALKMLVILGLALFPLGLMAVLASVDAARDGRAERRMLARSNAVESARALDALVSRDALALRIIVASAGIASRETHPCLLLRSAQRTERNLVLSRFALFGSDGRRLCGSESLRLKAPVTATDEMAIHLDPELRALRFSLAGGGVVAIAAIDYATIRALVARIAHTRQIDVSLEEAGRRLSLVDTYEPGVMQRTVVSRARLAQSNVFATASVGAMPISAAEIATIIMPLLMWLIAAMLGWWIVDRLLLRPIVGMQKAVSAYRPGGPAIAIPEPYTPATEIRDLGQAFVRVTGTIAAHEAELEAAIARQARLVREVHHRVKNNLQVVASLLNLHARGARSSDAANAYATIQRRVDALAVVHRNHFAELEDDRGIALRSLLSELTGNLRATAPDGAGGMAITLDLDAAYVNQDVAVSVAFFVTEVVEHAMMCAPDDPVAVTLRTSQTESKARLTLSSPSLLADAVCDTVDQRQFERITTGLSRQLRAVLERNGETGTFGIDINIQATPQGELPSC